MIRISINYIRKRYLDFYFKVTIWKNTYLKKKRSAYNGVLKNMVIKERNRL